MRICLISSSFYPAITYGGPISATLGLAKSIACEDFQVFISTTNANGNDRLNVPLNKFVQKEKNLFIKYYHEEFINRFSFSFLFGIWSDIKKSNIIYIQYLYSYTVIISLLFALIQFKKVVICPRGSFSSYTLTYKRPLLKRIWISLFFAPFRNLIIWHASSYLEKNDIKKIFPKSKVEIVNDGVDFNSFQSSNILKKDELIFKYTSKKYMHISNIFFSMGRLHKIKSFDILIKSFSIYIKEDKNAKLLIAGADDGEEKMLSLLIKKLKLQNSVFLIGLVNFDDKKILLNNCDYFTLASSFESFGIVIAEAMCCGKPIILSNKTPWCDLEANKCGILVNNDSKSFAIAFNKISSMKFNFENIKSIAKESFDWKNISKKFLEKFINN